MQCKRIALLLVCVGCGDVVQDIAPPVGDDAAPGSASPDAGSGGTGPVEPPPALDPVEPVWLPDAVGARVKSPNQRMRFTAGMPFRILADGNDPRAYQCPPGHPPYVCSDSSMTFFVDGAVVGTVPPDPANFNLWELRLPSGLPAGDHTITVRFTPHGAPAVDGLVPIYITVEPPPTKPVVELSQDLVLSGTTDLDWSGVFVKGNGHTITSAPGYAGKVIIRDSLVTGLAGFDNKVGIRVTTTGAVDITGSTFEATAPLQLVVNGSAPITLRGNELRSTNYVTYVSADPERSPILDLSGNTSGAKTMQGNNVGAGIVRISGMSGWQIGGLRDSQSNVFVGPRCVLQLLDSPSAVIQGNYLHHDYYGGFSQGFNLRFDENSSALAEHNVIRDSSWPLQSFGGEFRYNLMLNSGHDFVRSLQSGTLFHHNVLAHAQAPQSGYDGALLLNGGAEGIVFDNNTIDAGGAPARFDGPALSIGSGVSLASLSNNVFTQFSNGGALITGGSVARADHNAWHNPLAPTRSHGMTGAHDVTADPKFDGAVPQVPARIDEGSLWRRTYGVSQLLRYYRSLYTPRAGSPLIDAGDSVGNDIGAIGAGAAHPSDRFGTVMQADGAGTRR